MATQGTTVGTLTDLRKAGLMGKESSEGEMVDMLSEVNEMLQHIQFAPANNGNFMQYKVQTSLPDVFFRAINQPVKASKGSSAQILEGAAMLETWSEVDAKIAEGKNGMQYRTDEAQSHVEAMGQKVQQSIIYGDPSKDPRQFTGLTPRYSSLSAVNKHNVLSMLPTDNENTKVNTTNDAYKGDLTSVWLIYWDRRSILGFYPEGSKAGLQHRSFGVNPQAFKSTEYGQQEHMAVYKDQWMWDLGVCVRDWRQAVRICNIDVSLIQDETAKGEAYRSRLRRYLTRATHRINKPGMGRGYWYMNNTILSILDEAVTEGIVAGSGITRETVEGKEVKMYRGIQIGRVDQILNTEQVVTA